jgi:homoserine kinase type II
MRWDDVMETGQAMPSSHERAEGEQSGFDAILSQYFPLPPAGPAWRLAIGASGMNNTTRYVERGGNRYVLRIYETHRDEDKVAYEHHVLDCLTKAPIAGLPTPSPVTAMNGATVVHTPDGKLAALFHHREGRNPVLKTAADFHGFGWAAGALSLAMSKLAPEHAPLYRPYYELCLPTPEQQRRTLFAPLHAADAIVVDMQEALHAAEAGMARIHRKVPLLQSLPHQLIHGDLNASNVLADENNRIVALLDFEFVAWDLRVMELAVCLSEAAEAAKDAANDAVTDAATDAAADAATDAAVDAATDAPPDTAAKACIRALVSGFIEQVPLTREELAVLPDLLLLRRLDVFIHFLNRWQNGVDSPQNVRRFLGEVLSQTQWLIKNRDWMCTLGSCSSN